MGRLEGLVFVRRRRPDATLQSPGISLCSAGPWGSVGVGAFPLPSPDVLEASCAFFGEGFRGVKGASGRASIEFVWTLARIGIIGTLPDERPRFQASARRASSSMALPSAAAPKPATAMAAPRLFPDWRAWHPPSPTYTLA